ncbi:hypothetical protein O3M35_012824 [Rhynocoris fuscipes]|uniref:DUF1907 domain-containing protein n=1 Tax=Rhynocoris fuscipes TaxID=488301 RepID=A0AAW1CLC7_9HEMI
MSDLSTQLPVTEYKLDCLPLNDIAKELQSGLKNYFETVEVDVVNCPDLTKEPFNLAYPGLGGNNAILDIGGPPYLLPLYDENKIYHMNDIARITNLKPCFIIGAGAGPWPYVGKNCEMMANVVINGSIVQRTYIAKVHDKTEQVDLSTLPDSELRFALLANLYACQGSPSKVLKVYCKKRKESDNFITAIRLTLDKAFPDKTIGLGGTFLLKGGKAKQHIMPEFSKVPLHSDNDLNEWLKFYEMSAPLVAVGTLVSKPIKDLDLRIQHFHSFSNHGEGGHYHYDTTPEVVEYIGYFNVGQTLYRVDQPPNAQNFGKD